MPKSTSKCSRSENSVFLGWLGQLVNDAAADQSNFLSTTVFDRIILSTVHTTARCVFTRTTTRACRKRVYENNLNNLFRASVEWRTFFVRNSAILNYRAGR